MLPEYRLLLCCARARLDEEDAALLKELAGGGPDWRLVLELAAHHELTSLVSWHLNTVCRELVPAQWLSAFAKHSRQAAMRSLLLTGELFRVLDILEGAGISAVPLKGPVLGASVYGNPALRECVDIDVLVKPEHAKRAFDLLLSQGYLKEGTDGAGLKFLRWAGQVTFRLRKGAGSMDIHWGLMLSHFRSGPLLEPVWDRLEQATLDNRTVRTLAAEDLMLVLCVHGTKHMWQELKWICDVAELIRSRANLEWDRILETSGRSGARRMLLVGLTLARDLLGAPLPDCVLEAVRADRAAGALATELQQRWLREPGSIPGRTEEQVFRWKTAERLPDKLRYCAGMSMAPTEADWEAFPLPSVFYPVYYVLRPLRLAAKYSRRALECFG
jgi:hypothetical protein